LNKCIQIFRCNDLPLIAAFHHGEGWVQKKGSSGFCARRDHTDASPCMRSN
jgi:hypothetical protein